MSSRLLFLGSALAVLSGSALHTLRGADDADGIHKLKFAVTSVKPNYTGCCEQGGVGKGRGGGRNTTLIKLIGFSYRLQPFQISGGPGWVRTERFDVEGVSDDPKASNDEIRLMLQSLLEDRFSLRIRREFKYVQAYALVVAKGGPKIKMPPDQTSPDVDGPSPPGAGPNRGVVRLGAGNLVGNAVTLARFASTISPQLGRMVIDKTGMSGRFNIQMRWAPEPYESELPQSIVDMSGKTLTADLSGPSFFSALQEQLGLKLKAARAPVDMLVIDHAERPSAN